MYELYRKYIGARNFSMSGNIVQSHREDLIRYAPTNPDYHEDTLRNGVVQPLILTRGGENHSYNVICLPGDQLYAGDIIEAFGEVWIVIEARADDTTHKTGIMYQCNKLFRFQNWTSDIIECWAYVQQSGYSSTVTGTNQMQKSEEQVAIYMPYNEDTDKIYVDKRLASHRAWEESGRQILATYKITSASPITKSYNDGDHLLFLKAIKDVFSESSDSVEQCICDYIAPDVNTGIADEEGSPSLPCAITGMPEALIGRVRTLKAVFYDADYKVVEDVEPVWSYPEIAGVSIYVDNGDLKIKPNNESRLIGESFDVSVTSADGKYQTAILTVEVANYV